jgi:hypothetical protein
MKKSTASVSLCIGEYEGGLIIVENSRLKACLLQAEIMYEIYRGLTFREAVNSYGYDEVREVLKRPLYSTWLGHNIRRYQSINGVSRLLSHYEVSLLMEDLRNKALQEEDNPDEAPWDYWPDRDDLMSHEAWRNSFPVLNDLAYLPRPMPSTLTTIMHWPKKPELAGPCWWDIGARSRVRAILKGEGFSIIDCTNDLEKFEEFAGEMGV